jgi:hypothetical protein
MTFAETVSGAPASMTLRVLRLGLNDGSPTAGPDPIFWISAGGPAEPVTLLPGKVSVLNQNDTVVATAAYAAEPFDLYRIAITVQRPGSTWSLQIQNNESQPRSFTAVVADTDDGARQPWIKAPSTLQLTAPQGTTQLVVGTVNVVNYGTGPLTIQPAGLSDPFAMIPPDDVGPNSLGQLTIQYDPNKSGPKQQTLNIVTNDMTANAQPAHNHVVAVSCQTPAPPPPPPPPPPYGACVHINADGCDMYLKPVFGTGPCRRQGCGHSLRDHEKL